MRRHIRKVMCPRYLTGFCPKGPDCDMSHPKFMGITDSMRITLDPALRAIMAAKSEKAAAAAAAAAGTSASPSLDVSAEAVTSIDMDEAQVPEEAIIGNIEQES